MRVGVTLSYFNFFPELKEELIRLYPGAKFRTEKGMASEDELIEFLKDCDAAVIGLDRFTDRVCANLPDLKVVSLCSAGADHIDPAVLNKYGIKMWWVAGINKHSVAELAVCYMVMARRRLHEFSSLLRAGEWKGPIGFGGDLRGCTVGIHGCGHIGKEVVKLLQPYGVTLLAHDRADFSEFYKEWNVEAVSLDDLMARSDVVTVHLSRNKSTIGLYDDALLSKMKQGAVLVNIARGRLVDEKALYKHLTNGHLAAAAFDVFEIEPANGNPLLELPNLFGSPHIGATTVDSWRAMLRSGMHGVTKAWTPQPGVYPYD